MKQILQNIRTGATEVAEVPRPQVGPGQLLIRTHASLVSAGTERMLVEFGRAGWLDKARQQPDKVRMVLDRIKTDGLAPTVEAVFSKLDQPVPLGYCSVGIVVETGKDITGFAVGERVASNGKHAELVSVPINLCAKVPEGVSDDEAAFTVVAAVGLQGIRLAEPALGEAVVVTGLGLIGLVTVQLLRAHGCRVLGIDYASGRLALARQFGAETVNLAAGEDPIAAAQAFSRGRGVDAVLITASTESNEPIRQAALMCRKRGRIVLVGLAGLELSRADFYEKELSFQVSCSYGPGRYDPNYEEKGQDYPIGFVRWTEQRNFEAVLDMMADGRLDVKPLITHRFPMERAEEAYALLTSDSQSLGILLEYPAIDDKPDEVLRQRTVKLSPHPPPRTRAERGEKQAVVALVGAGNYAGRVLIPAFKMAGAGLHTIVSGGGVSAVHYGRKYGFAQASTDPAAMLADPAIHAVVVATRHDSHARYVVQSLQARKHVFCEKPLCLTLDDLQEIEAVYSALSTQHSAPPLLMVGFNRRFALQVVKIKALLADVLEPKAFVMTVNAGAIPPGHWTQDPEVGGGRIIGEGCHFIDLLRHLAGVPIVRHSAVAMGRHPSLAVNSDKAMLTLEFADGSIGTIHYLANGNRRFPKERLEVFCGGQVLQLDNFRKLRGWGWKGFSKMNLWRQDKGQSACVKAFVEALRSGGPAPIPLEEILEVSRVSIEAQQALS